VSAAVFEEEDSGGAAVVVDGSCDVGAGSPHSCESVLDVGLVVDGPRRPAAVRGAGWFGRIGSRLGQSNSRRSAASTARWASIGLMRQVGCLTGGRSRSPRTWTTGSCHRRIQREMALLSDLRLAPIRPAQLFALRALRVILHQSLFG
jgi:hypothetical protein